MLDYIWHLRGSVALDRVATNEAALDAVARLLEKQRKPVTERGPDFIAFDDPLWTNPFSPNWLAMVLYDRGRFWIEQGLSGRRLRYELRSLHGMVFCLCGALMFFFLGMADGGVLGGLKLAALAFGWLYGLNVLSALPRVPRSIRKAVHDA
ncbi:MAG: hypothetical protein ACR2KH_06290 [Sphingomicrobium sp.]